VCRGHDVVPFLTFYLRTHSLSKTPLTDKQTVADLRKCFFPNDFRRTLLHCSLMKWEKRTKFLVVQRPRPRRCPATGCGKTLVEHAPP
jgi:hypothetical protein